MLSIFIDHRRIAYDQNSIIDNWRNLYFHDFTNGVSYEFVLNNYVKTAYG